MPEITEVYDKQYDPQFRNNQNIISMEIETFKVYKNRKMDAA